MILSARSLKVNDLINGILFPQRRFVCSFFGWIFLAAPCRSLGEGWLAVGYSNFVASRLGYRAGSLGHRKTPRPGDGKWGWKDGWFSEAGLLATTEDLSRHSRYLRRRRMSASPPRPSRAAEEGSGTAATPSNRTSLRPIRLEA